MATSWSCNACCCWATRTRQSPSYDNSPLIDLPTKPWQDPSIKPLLSINLELPRRTVGTKTIQQTKQYQHNNNSTMTSSSATSSPRIPVALQEIFVASQSGQEIAAEKAPKNGIGFRMFKRSVGGTSSRRSHRSSTRPARLVAPKPSSLQKERNDGKTVETAAEASRKAMKKKQKEAQQQQVSSS